MARGKGWGLREQRDKGRSRAPTEVGIACGLLGPLEV